MKLFFFLMLMFFTHLWVSAQQWTPYFADSKLKIESRFSDCNDNVNDIHQQKIFFKYSNLTENTLEIDLVVSAIYVKNRKEIKSDGDVSSLHLTLLPKQTLEGNCKEKSRLFGVFSKMLNLDASVLKSFTITIKDIKNK